MKTKKSTILTVAIFLLLIITIAGCITNIEEPENNKTNNEGTVNYTENDTKNDLNNSITSELNTNSKELEPNTKISFKAGDIYNYKTTTINQTGKINRFHLINTFQTNDSEATVIRITYNVTEIGKVDKKDVYIIARNDTKNTELKINCYYNKETGELLKLKEIVPNKRTNLKGDRAFLESMKLGAIMFEDWMLSLEDDFNWKRTIDLGQEGAGIVINYKVVGTEKVGSRNCYKIEQKITTEAVYEQMNKNIAHVPDEEMIKSTIWVDKTRRIMIKSELKIGDMIIENVLIE